MEECQASQASPSSSDEMEEFFKVLEADVKSSSDLEAKKMDKLVNLNSRLVLKVEKVEQEKRKHDKFLTDLCKLVVDLKEVFALSTRKMQDRIFDLMK